MCRIADAERRSYVKKSSKICACHLYSYDFVSRLRPRPKTTPSGRRAFGGGSLVTMNTEEGTRPQRLSIHCHTYHGRNSTDTAADPPPPRPISNWMTRLVRRQTSRGHITRSQSIPESTVNAADRMLWESGATFLARGPVVLGAPLPGRILEEES